MNRYVAIAWNPAAPEQNDCSAELVQQLRSTFPTWICAFSAAGLCVYTSRHTGSCFRTYLLNANAGMVLGTLFSDGTSSDGPGQLEIFDEEESRRVARSAGRRLVERYWGRYVAFLRTEAGIVRILRDPSGAMACQVFTWRGMHIVCSHIADCAELGIVEPDIDWNHVVAFLCFHRIVTTATGLRSVATVRAGECYTISPDRVEHEFYWSPAHICQSRLVEGPLQAMRELRETILRCIGAWSSCYGAILHKLSGGLDSAIVLSCLARQPRRPRIVAVNFHTTDAEGDERIYARSVAVSTGVELRELSLPPWRSPERFFSAEKVASPSLLDLGFDSVSQEELVRRLNIDAVFSGQGGDHLFQRQRTSLIAAEYAARNGLGLALARIVTDTAKFARVPIWAVLLSVIKSGFLRRPTEPYRSRLKPPPFLEDDPHDLLKSACYLHPWIHDAAGLPGSKMLQIMNIIDSQNFYGSHASEADIVHPLISQPLIECCLQIPCYVLTYGGIDRALVRSAFKGVIPDDVLMRTSKGGTTSHVCAQIVENLSFIRECLLDGVLVRQGVLNRKLLEAALMEARLVRDTSMLFPVLNSIRAEVWTRAWVGAHQSG